MRHRLRHLGWRDLVVVATAVLLGVILGLVIWAGHRRDRQIDGLSTALAAQRRQASESGQTPVARAPDQVREHPERPTVKPQPGPTGPTGPAGLSIVGARIDGCDLVLIREDGQEYPAGPVCGPVGSRGPSGSPGAAGSPGPSGSPGADGQDGATGPQGPAGPPGKDGQDGADGQDGQPPSSWTWTYIGVTYRCTRDDGSPDSSPTYTCRPA